MSATHYVTTTIPYVNAPPHIGHAFELVQADALARYHRLRGADVRLQTGTDENAFKNVLSARALGISVQELVDRNAERFRALCDALAISHDRFLRTSNTSHHSAVQAFLARLAPSDVYRHTYRGLYCPGCEDFYLDRELVDNYCLDHRAPLVEVTEDNHFFRLSAYQARIRDLVATRRIHIVPETRELEVLRFIDRGLTDISLSRDALRSGGWGIPFPGDDTQVVYVWIDALVNYVSGLGFPDGFDLSRYWGANAVRTHLLGKNVWKFHAVYGPALLLSAGLDVPDQIVVHGFLTSEGQKISKSSGDAPDPLTYVQTFGADAVRFFLLRHVHPFEDTDFSVDRLAASYESDLANGLGNLTSRLAALCESADVTRNASNGAPSPLRQLDEHLENCRPDLGIDVLWTEIRQLNQTLNAERPWDDIKAGRLDVARDTLRPLVERLDAVAYWLKPFLHSWRAS